MSLNLDSFKGQVQALKDGKFQDQAATLIVESLKSHVQTGAFTWEQLGTSSVELNNCLIKQRCRSAGS